MFDVVLFIVLATAYSAFVIELVIESAATRARELVAFGSVLAAPGVTVGVWILCGVSASAALAMVTAVAYARGRRLERRMAAELDERWEEISERSASDATRIRLLSWRVAELQTLTDRLADDRAGSTQARGASGLDDRREVGISRTRQAHACLPAETHGR